MTDQATRVVPAGWYQDPALADQVRWWNGLAWTEHVREKPTVAAAPAEGLVVTATSTSTATAGAASGSTDTLTETAEDRIAASRELERQFGIGTSENEIITGATALGYGAGTAVRSTELVTTTAASASATPIINPAAAQAAAGQAGRRSTRPALRTAARSATGAAWLLALTPLLLLVAAGVAAYVYFYVAATPVVFVIAFLLPYLLGLLWALSDGRTLKSRGFDAPSPAWALLGGIGYLIVRRRRVPGSGPLIMFLVFGALVLGLPAAAYATGQLAPLSNALTIQNTIAQDYVSAGRAASINCPPFVDATKPGTLYTCDAVLASGVTKLVWVSIDGANGRFSYAMSL